jgi:hypothetical protein
MRSPSSLFPDSSYGQGTGIDLLCAVNGYNVFAMLLWGSRAFVVAGGLLCPITVVLGDLHSCHLALVALFLGVAGSEC